jgi:hypothetical protein
VVPDQIEVFDVGRQQSCCFFLLVIPGRKNALRPDVPDQFLLALGNVAFAGIFFEGCLQYAAKNQTARTYARD